MTNLPIQGILLASIEQIERLGIRYAVMGGFAARAWGLPRPTFDADIAVAVDAQGMQRLLDALESVGFDVPSEHRTGFLDKIGPFDKARVTRFVDPHVWSTDLFVVQGEFLNSALARAHQGTIGGAKVKVMAPEDIILLKLIAHRRKDLADVEEIATLCPNLDIPYMRRWATTLGIELPLREFFPGGE